MEAVLSLVLTRAGAVALSMLLVALAGCAGSDQGEDPTTTPIDLSPSAPPPTTTTPTNSPIGAPVWSTDTRWSWTITSRVLAAPITVITGPTKDAGANYHVGIDSQANYERA